MITYRPLPGKKTLVEPAALIPDALLEVRYASTRNAFGRAFYPFPAVFLLEPVAQRLVEAARALRSEKLRVVLYDGYRPLSVQRAMWALRPDPRFVADPARGSRHNRGAAVDLGLADLSGRPLAMPSGFDEFGPAAAHGGSGPGAANAARLRRALEGAGFKALEEEWWHYHDPAAENEPLLDLPFEALRP